MSDALLPWTWNATVPGQATGWSHIIRDLWALEREADRILAAGTVGEWHPPMAWNRVLRIDVVDQWTRQLTTAPDAVADRGAVRYRRPAPMRYVHTGRTMWVAGSVEQVTNPDEAWDACLLGMPVDAFTRVTLLPTHLVKRHRAWHGCNGRGWFGSFVVTGEAEQPARKAKYKRARVARQTARAEIGATGKRGTVTSVWSASERSIPRIWSKVSGDVSERADLLERILRGSTTDQVIELGAGHAVVIDHGAAVVRRDEPNSRAYGIRDYARRAAMAGLALD